MSSAVGVRCDTYGARPSTAKLRRRRVISAAAAAAAPARPVSGSPLKLPDLQLTPPWFAELMDCWIDGLLNCWIATVTQPVLQRTGYTGSPEGVGGVSIAVAIGSVALRSLSVRSYSPAAE